MASRNYRANHRSPRFSSFLFLSFSLFPFPCLFFFNSTLVSFRSHSNVDDVSLRFTTSTEHTPGVWQTGYEETNELTKNNAESRRKCSTYVSSTSYVEHVLERNVEKLGMQTVPHNLHPYRGDAARSSASVSIFSIRALKHIARRQDNERLVSFPRHRRKRERESALGKLEYADREEDRRRRWRCNRASESEGTQGWWRWWLAGYRERERRAEERDAGGGGRIG